MLQRVVRRKVHQSSSFAAIFCLVLSFGSVGCSSHIVNESATSAQTKQQPIVSKPKLSKAELAKIIAKKKAWITKRRKQQAEKKRKLWLVKKEALAKKKKSLQAKRTREAKSNRKSFYKGPTIKKTVWKTNRPYALTGDFAGNASAQSFIRQMARSYNMDVYYLNRLFSQARDLKLAYTPRKKPTISQHRNRGRRGKGGSWSRYRRYFITARHVSGGVRFWQQHSVTLNRTHQQYGVPPEYIVGILGVETIYGGNVGKTRVLDSLSTKSFRKGRRKKFFRNELEKFLLMAQSEGLNPVEVMGSSAGAVGLCQFMPSNFKPLGVDHNNNGVCNLWDPVDAIGSVANYLSRHGWRKGGVVAVRASNEGKGYKKLASGYKRKYSLTRLANKGVRPQGNIDSIVRFLRMSTYAGDELWLGGHNFYVITRYNHSGKYALAVHQLAQEIKRRYKGVKLASR